MYRRPSQMDRKIPRPPTRRFNAQEFLDSAGVKRRIVKYPPRSVIFSQGDPATDVLYIQGGAVRLSVLSKTGREAVVAMLGARDFFGEGCLAGQQVRMGTATAIAASTVLTIEKAEMVGTTRSRVNFFMNKFRKLGFIEYNGGIKINKSLLSVVLHE